MKERGDRQAWEWVFMSVWVGVFVCTRACFMRKKEKKREGIKRSTQSAPAKAVGAGKKSD
jgi:hypothetical protein